MFGGLVPLARMVLVGVRDTGGDDDTPRSDTRPYCARPTTQPSSTCPGPVRSDPGTGVTQGWTGTLGTSESRVTTQTDYRDVTGPKVWSLIFYSRFSCYNTTWVTETPELVQRMTSHGVKGVPQLHGWNTLTTLPFHSLCIFLRISTTHATVYGH